MIYILDFFTTAERTSGRNCVQQGDGKGDNYLTVSLTFPCITLSHVIQEKVL